MRARLPNYQTTISMMHLSLQLGKRGADNAGDCVR